MQAATARTSFGRKKISFLLCDTAMDMLAFQLLPEMTTGHQAPKSHDTTNSSISRDISAFVK